jgi:hypothetical protein
VEKRGGGGVGRSAAAATEPRRRRRRGSCASVPCGGWPLTSAGARSLGPPTAVAARVYVKARQARGAAGRRKVGAAAGDAVGGVGRAGRAGGWDEFREGGRKGGVSDDGLAAGWERWRWHDRAWHGRAAARCQSPVRRPDPPGCVSSPSYVSPAGALRGALRADHARAVSSWEEVGGAGGAGGPRVVGLAGARRRVGGSAGGGAVGVAVGRDLDALGGCVGGSGSVASGEEAGGGRARRGSRAPVPPRRATPPGAHRRHNTPLLAIPRPHRRRRPCCPRRRSG